MCLIARSTHEEALQAALSLIGEQDYNRKLAGGQEFFAKTDSVSFKKAYQLGSTEWLTHTLWTGAVRSQGPTAIALVGTRKKLRPPFSNTERREYRNSFFRMAKAR